MRTFYAFCLMLAAVTSGAEDGLKKKSYECPEAEGVYLLVPRPPKTACLNQQGLERTLAAGPWADTNLCAEMLGVWGYYKGFAEKGGMAANLRRILHAPEVEFEKLWEMKAANSDDAQKILEMKKNLWVIVLAHYREDPMHKLWANYETARKACLKQADSGRVEIDDGFRDAIDAVTAAYGKLDLANQTMPAYYSVLEMPIERKPEEFPDMIRSAVLEWEGHFVGEATKRYDAVGQAMKDRETKQKSGKAAPALKDPFSQRQAEQNGVFQAVTGGADQALANAHQHSMSQPGLLGTSPSMQKGTAVGRLSQDIGKKEPPSPFSVIKTGASLSPQEMREKVQVILAQNSADIKDCAAYVSQHPETWNGRFVNAPQARMMTERAAFAVASRCVAEQANSCDGALDRWRAENKCP